MNPMTLYQKKQGDFCRIFGIGLNKTGTTTLNRCFTILGLGPIAPGGSEKIKKCTSYILKYHQYDLALRIAVQYRCFEDRPWNLWEMYQKADQRFPGSKFILTVRDPENWWRSVERWLTCSKPAMLKKYCYQFRINCPLTTKTDFMEIQRLACHQRNETVIEVMKKIVSPLKEDMIAEYEKYNREVIEYFSGKERLLVVNFEKDCGWEPLCSFLNVPVPNIPLPHANQQYYDVRDLIRNKEILEKLKKKKEKNLFKKIGNMFR